MLTEFYRSSDLRYLSIKPLTELSICHSEPVLDMGEESVPSSIKGADSSVVGIRHLLQNDSGFTVGFVL